MAITKGTVNRAVKTRHTDKLLTQPDIPRIPKSEWRTYRSVDKLKHGRRPEPEYFNFLTDKKIILVGPASYLQGSGMGEEIDSYDIIVRLNLACPVPEHQYIDIGSRTDILYHTLFRDTHLKERPDLFKRHNKDDVLAWKDDGVQWAIIKPKPDSRHTQLLAPHISGVMPWCAISHYHHRRMREIFKTGPNMGSIAIWHILQSKCTSLYVTGCDFHLTGYFVGYGGFNEEQAARGARAGLPMNRCWGQLKAGLPQTMTTGTHFVPKQLEALARIMERDARFTADENLTDQLRGHFRR